MKATVGNYLRDIGYCYIKVGGYYIWPRQLPDISDSKTAEYHSEWVPGRAASMKVFNHSGDRTISFTIHCTVTAQSDIEDFIEWVRTLESALYPADSSEGAPFGPPKVCQIKCGELLSSDPICVVLKSCSVKAPTDCAWDETTLIPWKFSIDTQWDVVYSTDDLPPDWRIKDLGR